ncbi:hypothetical protein C5S42_04265 [Candidatus Methanomarinus sp.]|nr:hypothetical protein C5S42_04265 [ANME-2 cluster archaeon]
MDVFKVCVFYTIVYINLLNIKSHLYSIVGNNVREVERDVISRENLSHGPRTPLRSSPGHQNRCSGVILLLSN